MRELVILSGKGGTGKTSLTASFAVLAQTAVLADCDVDAANLHLVLDPQEDVRHEFRSGREAWVRRDDCAGCGRCEAACRFDAIALDGQEHGGPRAAVDPLGCEGCGVCAHVCPAGAIDFHDRTAGAWMVSRTRCGPMIHARLTPGADNSGKLVSTVRRQARALAEREGHDLILVDGPPGLACPAMAALTGCTDALVVTEPTLSGVHDLERVLALTRHFSVKTVVCVNKWDIDPGQSRTIERHALAAGAGFAGCIRYDRGVTSAQMQALTAVETDTACAEDIRSVWAAVSG